MTHLRISILFFALCITSSNVLLAQSQSGKPSSIPNIDSLLTHLDLSSILHQVNVDSIMHRVNIDSIMQHVNIDSLMGRMNLDSLMGRMNLDSLWKANRSKIESLFGSKSNSGALLYYADILPSEQEIKRAYI